MKKALPSYFSRHAAKIKGGIFALLAIYISGSVISYSPVDPSFNKASENIITNIFGYAGAYIADPLLQFMGIAVMIPVLVFTVIAYRNFFKVETSRNYLKVTCLIIATLTFASTASLFHVTEKWPFYVSMGGFFGDYLRNLITPFTGTYAFVAAMIVTGLTALYFALEMRFSELKYIGRCIRKAIIVAGNTIINASIFLINIVNKLRHKDLVSFKKKKEEKPEPEPKAKQDNIVEFKATKKKRAVQQTSLKLEADEFELPDIHLLSQNTSAGKKVVNQKSLEQNAKMLQKVLQDFGVKGDIIKVRPGPVVTLYELEPSPGTKSSRVIGLSDDIARSMSSISARISVIPGRNVLGIELPNSERETVYLRELIECEEYQDERIKLPFALGKDIGGESVMADLSRMPHLLIAGTTGSGKSVAVNAMILSYLYRLSPDECRFIMIDPKMLELSVYDGIPHLLTPVVTEPKKAVVALNWAVREMENRYRLMSHLGVRNITGYNKRIEDAVKKGQSLERTVQTGFDPETGDPVFEKQPLDMKKMPFIVVIVDEMADLMLTAGKEIEASIQRLAQMARAAGIHMVMATQRPSVDVITGVIKANFPTRISFQVTSRIDSRTILGEMGAEQLLGMGDMLYMAGGGRITRVHGPFVDDKEVDKVVKHLKSQGTPSYIEDITREEESGEAAEGEGGSGDSLYDQAVAIVLRDKKVSTSYIQRQLRIGYNRAANLIDKMEEEGVISPANHAGKREILVA